MCQRLFIIVISLSLFFLVALTTIIRADTKGVEVVEGPIVLHANIAGQWGGHTFCYLLQGKRAVFWSATAYPEQQPPTVSWAVSHARISVGIHSLKPTIHGS